MENAMKALGKSFGDEMILPPTAQDYSAEVAQATERCRLRDRYHVRDALHHLEHGLDPVRHQGSQYGPQGNLNEVSAKGNESRPTATSSAGMYPDISTKPWAEYRVALETRAATTPTELDYNSLGGMGTWAAYVAFAQIASTIKGDITAESFFDAAQKTRALDLGGMVPVLDFTKEWTDGLKGYERLFNRSVVFSKLENGKVVPVDHQVRRRRRSGPARPIKQG